MKRKYILFVIAVLFAVVAFMGMPIALSVSNYVAPLQSVYGSGSCITCHISSSGGARNSYGTLFENQPNHATDPVAALIAIGPPPGMTPSPSPTPTQIQPIPQPSSVPNTGEAAPVVNCYVKRGGSTPISGPTSPGPTPPPGPTPTPGPTPPPGDTVPAGYRLVWNDEFNNDLSNWVIITEDAANAPISNGNVLLTAYYKSAQGYISRSHIESKYSFQYGYIESRGRLSYVFGVSNDIWLMPASGSLSPEMDILERPGKVDWCLHSLMYDNGIWDSNYAHGGYQCTTSDGQYHIFGMLWEPDQIIFYVDGVEKWRAQPSWPSHFNVPMNIDLALCADIDVGCRYQGMGDKTNPNDLPTNFAVDYVRVYQK